MRYRSIFLICIGSIGGWFLYGPFVWAQQTPAVEHTLEKILVWMNDHPEVSPVAVIAVIERYEQKQPGTLASQEFLKTLIRTLEEAFYHPAADEIVTAEECYADEYFDVDQQRCLPAALQYNKDRLDTFLHAHALHGRQRYLTDTLYPDQTIYQVDADELIAAEDESVAAEHSMIRQLFTRLIPARFRQDVHVYSVFDDTDSEDAALVSQRAEGSAERILVVNQDAFFPADTFDPSGSVYTLVHEFAHLLTLRSAQMSYYPSPYTAPTVSLETFEKECLTHLLQEGCLREGSYLEAFLSKFWTTADLEATEYAETQDAGMMLYIAHPENFVTEYAATNPAEDIAESFVFFILEEQPTGTTLADQKIRFFRSYPELVTLRIHMRNRLRQLTLTDN